jgi:hypothetical protein
MQFRAYAFAAEFGGICCSKGTVSQTRLCYQRHTDLSK